MGYRGTAAFEYEKDGRDPLPGLAESVGYVRGVLAALGGRTDRPRSRTEATHDDGTGGPAAAPSAVKERLTSLDAFRGFDILTMVFVNYIAGMTAIPFILRHAAADQDVFTLTDVVFPGFLFIVGVSIPLALSKRRAEGRSGPALVGHVLVRTLALLFLGVLLVNEDRFSAAATGLSRDLWYFLATLAVFALWAVVPKGASADEKAPAPRPQDRRGDRPGRPRPRLPRPG